MPTKTASSSLDVLTFSAKVAWPWHDPATALAAAYRLADDFRVFRAGRAIGTGLIALIAKDTIKHGDFQLWAAEALGFVQPGKKETVSFLNGQLRTLRNYMALASAWLRASGAKPAAIHRSAFIRWAFDSSADIQGDAVWNTVAAYIGERSLTDIYVDEGIKRERDPHQRHTPSSLTPAEAVQLELDGILSSLDTARANVQTLFKTGDWEKVPKEKRFEFIADALPAIESFAVHTSWTPAERAALEAKIVNLSTALRAAGKGEK